MSKDVLQEYAQLAPHYERRWARYLQRSTDQTLRRLVALLTPEATVLDIGCGTGVLLEALASGFPDVTLTGVDPSAAMLQIARNRLPGQVRLVEGLAEALPFDDGQFDLVVSVSAFHYFNRPIEALGEMRRVLKPGGQLLITDWCDDYLLCKVWDLVLRLMGKTYYKMYGTRECAGLLRDAGFEIQAIERYKIDWLWGLMTLRAVRR